MRMRLSPKSFSQILVPFRSYAYRPNDSKYAYRRSPSVMAELDAHVLLSVCEASCGSCSRATRSQISFPDCRSYASTVNLWTPRGRNPPRGECCASPVTPAGTAVVTNTLSPQTMGVDDPRPGMGVFQRMFFDSLHSSGGVAAFERPLAYGPRHCGQKRSNVVDDAGAWASTTRVEITTAAVRTCPATGRRDTRVIRTRTSGLHWVWRPHRDEDTTTC